MPAEYAGFSREKMLLRTKTVENCNKFALGGQKQGVFSLRKTENASSLVTQNAKHQVASLHFSSMPSECVPQVRFFCKKWRNECTSHLQTNKPAPNHAKHTNAQGNISRSRGKRRSGDSTGARTPLPRRSGLRACRPRRSRRYPARRYDRARPPSKDGVQRR